MLIPLRTDRPLRRPTRVTHVLIAACAAVYAAQLMTRGGGESLGGGPLGELALSRGSAWWTYLTYAFLHDPAGVMHILGNALVLFVFGPAVEDRLGRAGFAAFYAAGAALAGVAHVLTSGASVIGASGAISAVTGAFLVLFPRSRVQSFMFLFVIGVVMVPAWFFIGLAIARDLLSLGAGRFGVAYTAHLGGYAFGATISFALLAARVIPREPYDLFSVTRQANRRRAFREAGVIADDRRARVRERAPARAVSAEDALTEAIAAQRAMVTRALAEGRGEDAAASYRVLVERHGRARPAAATLNKRAQFEIAGELYRRGEFALADFAFSRYVDAFPDSGDAAEVRVVLARIKARHTGEPEAAAAMLEHAIRSLGAGSVREAAEAELALLRSAGGAA